MALFQREALLQAIRKILAATLACHEDDFTQEGTILSVAEIREGRMKFPSSPFLNNQHELERSTDKQRRSNMIWVRREVWCGIPRMTLLDQSCERKV